MLVSVMVTVVLFTAVVGVPVIAPVEVLRLKPAGRPDTEKVGVGLPVTEIAGVL